jgi:hypothetical protein
MVNILDGLNSMPWVSLGRLPNGWVIELAQIPPRDKFKYSYDLWSNGLAFEAFGIARTYKATIRAAGYGDGLWLLNFDTQGRLLNASYTGARWGPFEISAPTQDFSLLAYPRYRPEIHRLIGGTWLRAKWIDKYESSHLTYRLEIVEAQDALYQAAMRTLDDFVRALSAMNTQQNDPLTERLLDAFRKLPLRTHTELDAEAARFHEILGISGHIPVEPPELALDHYHAIPLKVQDGCGGLCTFCSLYGRKIRIAPVELVFRQIDLMAEYLGEELDHFTKVALLQGDALVVPPETLARELEYAREKFALSSSSAFAHAFAKATTVARAPVPQLVNLKKRGLLHVNLGLESGCQDVLNLVKKGQELSEFHGAVSALCEAGIGVSVNIILGVGGLKFKERHVQETVEFVRSLPSAVTVFYSPLQIASTSYYVRNQESSFGRLSDSDMIEQENVFQRELGAYKYLFVPI